MDWVKGEITLTNNKKEIHQTREVEQASLSWVRLSGAGKDIWEEMIPAPLPSLKSY